jgi:ubiquinone biosynthesis protein UbiJ
MANDAPPDPTAQFREMLTQWERGVDEFMNRVMGTEDFSRSMNQLQRAQLTAQKAFSEFLSQQWTNMNLPTREDVVTLAETIRALDARVERVEQMLKQLTQADSKAARVGPPRTKQPPGTTPPQDRSATDAGRGNQ